jgi:hypothetical protein
MKDPWLDRLSEYIDDGVASDERRALERHLESCDVCRATIIELRAVVARAASLEDAPPAHELWAGIAARLEPRTAAARFEPHTEDARFEPRTDAALPRPEAAPGVLPLQARREPPAPAVRPRRARFDWGRARFSAQHLAAAALLFVSLSAGAIWLLAGGSGAPDSVMGTVVHAAGNGYDSHRLVGSPPAPAVTGSAYAAEAAELEVTLAELRTQLDPATVDVIERSIAAIDQAIADARAALVADPGNPHLDRQLDSTIRKKHDILRRAQRVQRAGT